MEITFKSDTKQRNRYFTGASFAHPAKMVLPLQRWLIENYTKHGDVVLDPMAGCGTLLIACTMGRNVILFELEDKFVQMQQDNWAKIQTIGPEMGCQMGTATILQGDARNLEGILADAIISSPPYEGSDVSQTHMTSDRRGDPVNPNYRPSWKRKLDEGYAETKRPYADVILTSPPYEASLDESKNTTSNLKREERLRTAGHQPKKFMGGIGRNASLEGGMRYSKDDNNIGNLKGEPYLQSMARVYSQCFKVLRPQGLLCLVVKPFIRNKQVVRLEDDTQRLCEQCGFTLVEKHHRLLTSMSFWRTLYYQKNPTVERVDKEYILVFKKDGGL